MMRSISIFGATGSIGQSARRLLTRRDDFNIEVLTGHKNAALMIETARDLRPAQIVMCDQEAAQHVSDGLAQINGYAPKIEHGEQALQAAASISVDVSLQAIVGFSGVLTSLEAAKYAKRIALANKESLVCAGALLRALCARSGAELLPVDSEHAALHQCLAGRPISDVSRLILTASGGPFRDFTPDQMVAVTPDMAQKHPNWDMGQRISIDSASMFNKAMEMIEAQQLFDIDPAKIDAVIHPQSLVHSLVEWSDHSMLAQLSVTDMIGPIAYALAFPEFSRPELPKLDLVAAPDLQFLDIDTEKFPAITLARDVMAAGGLNGTVFNAAKEAALDRFIAGDVGFLDMAILVERTLDHLSADNHWDIMDMTTIRHVNNLARNTAKAIQLGS